MNDAPEPDRPGEQDAVFACVAEIKRCRREGRVPLFAAHPVSIWARALDVLHLAGRLDVMEYGVRHLHAAHPAVAYAANFCRFFDRLPPDDAQLLPFRDDSRKEVQVVPREGSETVLILFCDYFHRLGLPLNALHRWLGHLPANLIYLRDFQRLCYLRGVPSLGADRAATVGALREITGSLGGRRIVCCGDSVGGYGALLYGLELGATAVLAMGTASNLSNEFNAHLRTEDAAKRLQQAFPGGVVDLRPAYAEASSPPRATLVYCENDWDDRLHAEYLAGLPGIALHGVPGCDEHNVIMALIRNGEFEPLLDALVAG